ncbi:hypothetical protein Bca4012_048650 [Brassica carinata]
MEGGGGVKLHVGGLGESVGRYDLLKIFSSMGSVDAVEFVRTKGRSFVYIDFFEKSLPKLFSTEGGCGWRKPKRKNERSQLLPLTSPLKILRDSTPSTHLNIFFPKLRKHRGYDECRKGKLSLEGYNVDLDMDEGKAGEAPFEACSKSWLQRASWTQLVSDKNASFSITQLFPDLASDSREEARVNSNGDGQFSNSNQNDGGMKQRDHSCSACLIQ